MFFGLLKFFQRSICHYTGCMKIAGIVAEYNPFHEGHLYQLKKTRELLNPDVLVVIVTGCFSSRGLPCLINMEDKTRMALEAGADLVLMLPVIYGCQSADRFALYAIESLKTAGVNMLCFGSETNDIPRLQALAGKLEHLEGDPSTSLARNVSQVLESPRPNDILGIQYVRWCKEFGIEPVSVLRDQTLKSATAIRKDFFGHIWQPMDYLFSRKQSWEGYYPLLRYELLMSDPKDIEKIFLVREGIEHRLKKAALSHERWEDFLEAVISKGYSRSFIQRVCLMILLHINKKEMKGHESFFALQVLGMNETGRKHLSSLPKGTPIYSRFRDLPEPVKSADLKSRQLYSLIEGKEQPWKIVMEKDK